MTVAAGVRYGDLAAALHAAGFALHNLGSLPHISVAGAVSTGTHGSGDGNGNLATAVRGAASWSPPTANWSRCAAAPAGSRGAVVALGALGVVVDLTLDVEPAYEVRQYVYEGLPLGAARGEPRRDLRGRRTASACSPSWAGPVVDQVWVKRRVDRPGPRPRRRVVPGRGRRPTGPRHPILSMPADNCTAQLGVPGPWHERLPHFRLDFTPSAGDELQSEFLVPRDRAVGGTVRDRRDPRQGRRRCCRSPRSAASPPTTCG